MAEGHNSLQTIIDEDGAAILDIERGQISLLNDTGGFVWQRMQQGDTVEAIVAALVSKTGADEQVIERDIRTFLDSLKKNALVQMSTETSYAD
jgi:hypothetical protein